MLVENRCNCWKLNGRVAARCRIFYTSLFSAISQVFSTFIAYFVTQKVYFLSSVTYTIIIHK